MTNVHVKIQFFQCMLKKLYFTNSYRTPKKQILMKIFIIAMQILVQN